MSGPLQLFTEQDCRRLTDHPWLHGAEIYHELDSTNRRALECCEQLAPPHLVVAERQTAGRGRQGSRWWSELGGLMFSLTLDAAAYGLTPPRRPVLSLVAGLAVRQTLAEMLGVDQVQLKWPNDVYVGGRKICGILLESSAAQPQRVVIGVGMNVSNDLARAPADVQRRATSLCQWMTPAPTPAELLELLLERLRTCLELLAAGRLELTERWRSGCMLSGRTIRVELPTSWLEGVCQGIDSRGALVVQTGAGREAVVAGVVVEVDGVRIADR